ncbi:MAG: nucleoside kinase [Bacteroidales bacterium]|nr:nucleoside kinase [Bacteroidales bacterium]
MIEIICTNNNVRKCIPSGMSLQELAEDLNVRLNHPILGAKVNNQLKSLNYEVYNNKVITFIDATDAAGYGMYERSLCFLLYKAVKDLYPKEDIEIKHSISGGKFCEFENPNFEVTDAVVQNIKKRMMQLVADNIPFIRENVLTEEALSLYSQKGMTDKEKLLKNRKVFYTSVYELDKTINYFFGCLVPTTGYLKTFDVVKYENGLLLSTPSRHVPNKLSPVKKSPKLFNVFKEHKEWVKIIGSPYVGDLNEQLLKGKATEVILLSEALHEKKLVTIADEIKSREGVKIVLISGPSSSGKTTSCRRLSVQLGVLGFQPVQLSVDNYFVEREQTPLDENGNYDFEHVNALDLDLFNSHLQDLIAGKEIDMPTFDFVQGKKVWKGNKLRMNEKSLLVVEGIHCLNPLLTQSVDNSKTYKVFVSALTSLAIDKHNPIHSSDNRLIRRIVRDYNYRGYSAEDTISRWPSVRNGEEKWIFPFQENADAMFNSAMLCELSLLKKHAVPIINKVPECSSEYTEAHRLRKLLSYFVGIEDENVPHYSILREFFGGSIFSY